MMAGDLCRALLCGARAMVAAGAAAAGCAVDADAAAPADAAAAVESLIDQKANRRRQSIGE